MNPYAYIVLQYPLSEKGQRLALTQGHGASALQQIVLSPPAHMESPMVPKPLLPSGARTEILDEVTWNLACKLATIDEQGNATVSVSIDGDAIVLDYQVTKLPLWQIHEVTVPFAIGGFNGLRSPSVLLAFEEARGPALLKRWNLAEAELKLEEEEAQKTAQQALFDKALTHAKKWLDVQYVDRDLNRLPVREIWSVLPEVVALIFAVDAGDKETLYNERLLRSAQKAVDIATWHSQGDAREAASQVEITWINVHGSDHLKNLVAEGLYFRRSLWEESRTAAFGDDGQNLDFKGPNSTCRAIYQEERRAVEFPNWVFSRQQPLGPPKTPTSAELDMVRQARTDVPEGTVVHFSYAQRNLLASHIVWLDYLDRRLVYIGPNTNTAETAHDA